MGGLALRMRLALLAIVAAFCAGCSAQVLDEFGVEEEEALGEVQSAAVVGCASITITSSSHTGTIIGDGTPTREIVVDQLKYRIKNPSTTDCSYVEFTFALKDTTGKAIRSSNIVKTSLSAGYSRSIYWNVNFDSRDLGPRAPLSQRFDVSAQLKRNGSQISLENLLAYFYATGQY